LADKEATLDTHLTSIDNLQALKKIGHITPSSNTTLEPLTAMLNYQVSSVVSNHFTRIPVTKISLDNDDTGRFEIEKMVEAARLLADAPMDAILWNGTSGSWNGTEADIEMCRRITEETGVPASTSTLAQYEVFERFGMKKFGLAVPYLDDVTAKAMETYERAGYKVVSVANLNKTVNREFAQVSTDRIKQLLRDADSPEAECLAVVCTNFAAALVVEEMEQELGKPIFDSVVVTLWKGFDMAGVRQTITGWGTLLETEVAQSGITR
jgi:maleate isomerase